MRDVKSQKTHVEAEVREKRRVRRNGQRMIMKGVKWRYSQKMVVMEEDVDMFMMLMDGNGMFMDWKRDAGRTLWRSSSGLENKLFKLMFIFMFISGEDLPRMDWMNSIICIVKNVIWLNVVSCNFCNPYFQERNNARIKILVVVRIFVLSFCY